MITEVQYQTSSAGALAHRLQRRTARFWGILSLNNFFDQSTPSMRKVDDGEKRKKKKEKKEKENNDVYSGH